MSPERENLYRGLSHAAWGYFFLHIDFNLNAVSILPKFVGWLLLLSAIGKLSGERRDLALLRPLAVLLSAWSALNWLLSWAGLSANGRVPFLDLLVAATVIYFHFQFLTDMAALAEAFQPEGGDLDRRLRRRRTVYVLAVTAIDLLIDLSQGRSGEIWGYAALGAAAVGLITALFLMAGLFELRKCFRDQHSDLPQA